MSNGSDHPTAELAVARPAAARRRRRGLDYAEFRFEAILFLLVAITFAAVLGKSAITSQTLLLSPESGRFDGYIFSDMEAGGRSTVAADPHRPLAWSCEIKAGVEYPFCGYGLLLGAGSGSAGVDFSHLDTITLRFSYHGNADRLRLLIKAAPAASIRDKVKGEVLPLATDFPVVQGANVVSLPLAKLAPEQWWIANHGLSVKETAPDLRHAQAVAITTSGAKAGDRSSVTVDAMTLHGDYVSAEQFYLIILGLWLVMSAAFLVHRFLRVRARYELRQRRQAVEKHLLTIAHAEAEAASTAKSRFLGNMSHELRTPLNAVIGYAYWLENTPLDARQRDAARTIKASGEHLLAMISDILDVAKIEAGKFELVPAPFDLRACIGVVGEMFRLAAQEKGLAFAVEIGTEVPRAIVTDQKRLRQVLINLLGNAIKFTEAGQVSLRVVHLGGDDATARLRFVVEDTGIGIAADRIDAIFRPFEQAGDTEGRAGGTGLGLSISRQIVELMEGDIDADSTPGQGSRFTVEAAFPIADLEAAPEPRAIPRLRRLGA